MKRPGEGTAPMKRPGERTAPIHRANERGVAAITALLVVAVAAGAAAWMLSQQSATLNQAALVASRAQTDLYADAGLDWARGILAEDGRNNAIDSLDEAWARPMVGLPVERAIVGGAISDAQSRYNLNNLVKDGVRSDADFQAARRLFDTLGVEPGLVDAIVDWIDADSEPTGNAGAEDSYYFSLPRPYRTANRPLMQLEELYRVRGFDSRRIERLRPFVATLPARTTVNVNTASAEVLSALLPTAPIDEIRALVAGRAGKPVRDRQDLAKRFSKPLPAAAEAEVDVKSAHFLVVVSVAQDDVRATAEALVSRPGTASGPSTAIIWRRPLY
jgi:general secretion pathway protein K